MWTQLRLCPRIGLRGLATTSHFGNSVQLSSTSELAVVQGRVNTIPSYLTKYVARGLHNKRNHPLSMTKNKVLECFNDFPSFTEFPPLVSTKQAYETNFISPENPMGNPKNAYYYSNDTILRPHSSCYQNDILSQGLPKYILCAEVFRKRPINPSSFPVSHEIEAVNLFPADITIEAAEKHLKHTLHQLCSQLFGQDAVIRWKKTDTNTGWTVEVLHNEKWVEMIEARVLEAPSKGWWFRLGVEQAAMLCFEIPDVRYFWGDDARFLYQFKEGLETKMTVYTGSKKFSREYSFFLPEHFLENDFFDMVLSVGGDWIERVELCDEFVKDGRDIRGYKVSYRALDMDLYADMIEKKSVAIREMLAAYGCQIKGDNLYPTVEQYNGIIPWK